MKWVLEQQQKMKPNLVPKYNLFGNSALEIGSVPTKEDFELDSFENGIAPFVHLPHIFSKNSNFQAKQFHFTKWMKEGIIFIWTLKS